MSSRRDDDAGLLAAHFNFHDLSIAQFAPLRRRTIQRDEGVITMVHVDFRRASGAVNVLDYRDADRRQADDATVARDAEFLGRDGDPEVGDRKSNGTTRFIAAGSEGLLQEAVRFDLGVCFRHTWQLWRFLLLLA